MRCFVFYPNAGKGAVFTVESYLTFDTTGCAEVVERRSRFIAAAAPAMTPDDVQRFLEERRRAHWDARHHVFAYRLREGAVERFTDDGEPQGSAGLPVLKVLQGEDLIDGVVVVTRYFGGTLLGTGGLARAYAQAAKGAVTAAGRRRMVLCTRVCIRCDYGAYGWIGPLIQETQGFVEDTQFDDGVTLYACLPRDRYDAFAHTLTDRSAGTVKAQCLQTRYAPLGTAV